MLQARNAPQLVSMGLGVVVLLCAMVLLGCVTHTINSDGTLQNKVIDQAKLSATYVELAYEYQKRNALPLALDNANLALKSNPENVRAYLVRALLYQQLKQDELAEANFKHALAIKQDSSAIKVSYAVFLCGKKRYIEALEQFSQALHDPLYYTPAIGYYSRGSCYIQQGQDRLARQDLLQSVSYPNPPAEAYLELAKLELNSKNFTMADHYLRKFTGVPNSANLWLQIQILQGLLDYGPVRSKIQEYTRYFKILAQQLLNNFRDSPEAQQYIIKYPAWDVLTE